MGFLGWNLGMSLAFEWVMAQNGRMTGTGEELMVAGIDDEEVTKCSVVVSGTAGERISGAASRR